MKTTTNNTIFLSLLETTGIFISYTERFTNEFVEADILLWRTQSGERQEAAWMQLQERIGKGAGC